jgi:hypothetical protein
MPAAAEQHSELFHLLYMMPLFQAVVNQSSPLRGLQVCYPKLEASWLACGQS